MRIHRKWLISSRLLALFGSAMLLACSPPPAPPVAIVKPHSKPVKVSSIHQSLGKSTVISLEELFALQQSGNVLIYDVRVPYFYQIDHLPGAINWPHTEYAAQIQTRDLEIQTALNSGKRVVFYCFNFGCAEARNVAHKLAQRDYKISVFRSGIDAWRAAGLPLK
jgi:rhodanese-related sulfurtransferase